MRRCLGRPRNPARAPGRSRPLSGLAPSLPAPSAYGGSLAPPRNREPFQLPFICRTPKCAIFLALPAPPTPSARDFAPRRLDSQDGLFLGGGWRGGRGDEIGGLSPPPSPPSGSLSFRWPWIRDREVGIPERGASLPFLRCLHSPHSQCCLNWGNSSDLLYP